MCNLELEWKKRIGKIFIEIAGRRVRRIIRQDEAIKEKTLKLKDMQKKNEAKMKRQGSRQRSRSKSRKGEQSEIIDEEQLETQADIRKAIVKLRDQRCHFRQFMTEMKFYKLLKVLLREKSKQNVDDNLRILAPFKSDFL